MSLDLSELASAYVNATNAHDPAAFSQLFLPTATVDDNHRELRGRDAIDAWAKTDIFDANVTLEVLKTATNNGSVVLTTKVDGDFDRTGLPDPVIITQEFQGQDGKIAKLTCRLEEG